ncbi:MAG TPA: helix-turn-helix transcriptional regulator [Candidatus Acidoferrales bacterium]|nr:helix-turn-helix transcriptional regulator [Candidatus Acidoferrales bacterium]
MSLLRERPGTGVDRRVEVARFLRAKRESLAPLQVGLKETGRRRTPGLRREEVAMLAGIGVAWYTRLETARDVTPSAVTLEALAEALRLSAAEREYLFTLVGLPLPERAGPGLDVLPDAVERLIDSLTTLGAVIYDRFMTALRWNAIADSFFDISRFEDPLERNALVRYVTKAEAARSFFGADYDELLRSLVGVFRLAFLTTEVTPLAGRVYDAVKGYETFQRHWNDHLVSGDVFDVGSGCYERSHPVVGTVRITVSNLRLDRHDNTVLRIIAPTDEPSRAKFERLHATGTASTRAGAML